MRRCGAMGCWPDRKSTRLNSSHLVISYAVFCLKKKKKKRTREEGDENILGVSRQSTGRMYLLYRMSLHHFKLNLPSSPPYSSFLFFFFFNDTATTEIYTLSLHDALPI